MKKIIVLFLMISMLCTAEEASRPKIGLVLGGGGAKGFAHIGVLKVLEKEGIKPDYIAGNSMGGLVGALYSMGYTPNQIEKIVSEVDWDTMLGDSYSRRYLSMEEKEIFDKYFGGLSFNEKGINLPSGIIAGQKLYMLLCRLSIGYHGVNDFLKMPIPFVCVATDIATGESVTLKSGYLPDALRATMSIPTAFAPANLDGKILIDGFLSQNLPVTEVKEMGADIVIAVDVGDPLMKKEELKSMVEILNQTITLRGYESVIKERQKADIVIVPNVRDYDSADFKGYAKGIKKGEEEAEARIEDIKKAVSGESAENNTKGEYYPMNNIFIRDIELKGLKKVSKSFINAVLNIKKGKEIKVARLEEEIDKLYSTKFFRRVYYRYIEDRLYIYFEEKEGNTFNLGFNYNTEDKAAVIINGVFDNVAEKGSRLSADLKLGENMALKAIYSNHPFGGIGMKISGGYTTNKGYYYRDGKKNASFDYHNGYLELFAGNIYSTLLTAGGGVRREMSFLTPDVSPFDLDEWENGGMIFFGLVQADFLDSRYFPKSGGKIEMKLNYSNKDIFGAGDFLQACGEYRRVIPIGEKVSIDFRAEGGSVSGSEIPFNYYYYIGGVNGSMETIPFYGINMMEKKGSEYLIGGTGVRIEAAKNRYIMLSYNRGKIGTSEKGFRDILDKGETIEGAALVAGAMTPVGPFISGITYGNGVSGYLNIGFQF